MHLLKLATNGTKNNHCWNLKLLTPRRRRRPRTCSLLACRLWRQRPWERRAGGCCWRWTSFFFLIWPFFFFNEKLWNAGNSLEVVDNVGFPWISRKLGLTKLFSLPFIDLGYNISPSRGAICAWTCLAWDDFIDTIWVIGQTGDAYDAH